MKYLLTCCIAAAFLACNPPTKQNPDIKNKSVDISYQKSGTGDTALVFVHGWCINKEYWKSQQDFFSNRFTTVALDLGGHGQSGKNRDNWSVDEYADDVIAVINGLGLTKVILVGHSMSGDINLAVANKIPGVVVGFAGIDNLKDILTSYSPEQQAGINGFFESAKTNFDSVATAYCYGSLFPRGYTDSVPMKRVVKDVQEMDSVIAIKTLEEMVPATLKEGAQLSNLKVPVYLIISSDMGPMNDTAVSKYCKNGLTVKKISGVGHYPMIEKPDTFNLQLQEVVNEMATKK